LLKRAFALADGIETIAASTIAAKRGTRSEVLLTFHPRRTNAICLVIFR
jgi:hypothetical protein